MKRKAEQAELQMLQNSHWTKSMRTEPDYLTFIGDRSNTQLSTKCQTPAKPIPVYSSTPSCSGHVSEWKVKTDVMDVADAELRRVVDNFVSIYEQLDKCEGSDVKPNYSYTELAYLAMLRSPNFCLPITEIYRYIQSRFLFFKNSTRKHWKNAVRHSLAKTMCFTKIAIGRGISNSENLSRSTYLWCIVPNSIASFARGDYRPSVDKESGTNTLRWGYMRVNAGQFWDQVGNYIANKMLSFRKFVQESPHPGQIFEQQVCQTPDSNMQPLLQTINAVQTSYNSPTRENQDEQFGFHGYRETPQYMYGLSRLLEGVETKLEPVLAVPAQGYCTGPQYCQYGNSPVLGNRISPGYRANSGLNSQLCNTTNTHNSDRLTMTPPLRMTPSQRSTPTHTMLDTNDSGFESCGSSPEVQTTNSCRLPLQQQPSSQISDKYSVNSCDFLESELPLDFSFNEPDFSSFCDSLLHDSFEQSDSSLYNSLEDQSCMKENISASNWLISPCDSPKSNIYPDRQLRTQQQQFGNHSNYTSRSIDHNHSNYNTSRPSDGNHGDCRFSGSDDHQSSLVSCNDPMLTNWQIQKPWY